jgi:hypothetical protein
MSERHSKATIVSIAVLASAAATFLHEAVGHGLVAWWRGDVPTELTSNHLSSVHPDHWVQAGGTLANLIVGAISLVLSRDRVLAPGKRYFYWLFAAFNLLAGCGYFLFSGVLGLGDWRALIEGLPNQVALRLGMSLLGAALYLLAVRLIAMAARPFCPDRKTYNVVGRLPYLAACLFSCAAGVLDPMGWKLLLLSTLPAVFGGYSGLLWADRLMPGISAEPVVIVGPARAWWVGAFVIGLGYIVFLGRGIHFRH